MPEQEREESNAHANATLSLLREAEKEGIDVDDAVLEEYEEKAKNPSDEPIENGGDGA